MNRSRKRSNFNITGASSQREREKPSSQLQTLSNSDLSLTQEEDNVAWKNTPEKKIEFQRL